MRQWFIGAIALVAMPASAQLADGAPHRIEPNAIDRSLSQRSTASLNTQADADRRRAEQAARDATTRRALPLTSTMLDGPAGVQRSGAGVSAAASPLPPLPQR